MATALNTPNPTGMAEEQQGPQYLYRVYLAMPHQSLPKVIQWTRLAVWGSRMYDRVKLEMLFYAWMLVAIASFDLAAWSLLFNQILNSGSFHWTLTPASIGLGLGIAFLLFMYERQVVVYDISRGKKRLFSAFGFRCAVVVLAALLTSQPIELLLFREPIQHRIREESIRGEAIGKGRDIARMEQNQRGEVDDFGLRDAKNEYEDSMRRLRIATGDKATLRGALLNAENRRRDAKLKEDNVKADIKTCTSSQQACPALVDLNKQLSDAQQEGKKAEADKSVYETTLKDREIGIAAITQERDAADKRVNGILMGPIDLTKKRVRNWVAAIRALPEGLVKDYEEPIPPPREAPWKFGDRNYDFIQKLRVLDDLRNGRPPRWPEATDSAIVELSKEFNLSDPGVEQVEARIPDPPIGVARGRSPFESESRNGEIALFKISYRLVFGIAVLIPLMSFAFKLLMPPELADYYSVRFQEKMGNPQARSYLEQKKEIEVEDRIALRELELVTQADERQPI